ncbi:MAG: hypothetical protein ACFCBW_12525 [Candidatus Competibacterales bacterium]
MCAHHPALEANIQPLAAQLPPGLKTRCHGDYHLEQLLMVDNDFVIIDFEGEPARPLAERRAKASPLKDVACLLRSLDYAARTALANATADRPQDRQGLIRHLAVWQSRSTQAFWEGYSTALASSPLAATVQNPRAKALVDLYGLQRALYELRFELDNRPEWTTLPLEALLAWLD